MMFPQDTDSIIVMRGLDPRIYLLRRLIDRRVEPGDDELRDC